MQTLMKLLLFLPKSKLRNKLIQYLKIKEYKNIRSKRINRYSPNYIKRMQPHKYKIGDILFIPDFVSNNDGILEPKIWKVKITEFEYVTEQNRKILGNGYKCKALNARVGEHLSPYVCENLLYKSYSHAFQQLKKRVALNLKELEYDNWIDFPY